MSFKKPPDIPCQTLVNRAGNTKIAMAGLRPRVATKRAKDTEGRPRPITPLTNPETRNTTVIITNNSREGRGDIFGIM